MKDKKPTKKQEEVINEMRTKNLGIVFMCQHKRLGDEFDSSGRCKLLALDGQAYTRDEIVDKKLIGHILSGSCQYVFLVTRETYGNWHTINPSIINALINKDLVNIESLNDRVDLWICYPKDVTLPLIVSTTANAIRKYYKFIVEKQKFETAKTEFESSLEKIPNEDKVLFAILLKDTNRFVKKRQPLNDFIIEYFSKEMKK